jgi:hypothetical protein
VTALADTTDVATALERALTTAETAAAAGLIELASGAVESATQRLFAPGDYTVTRRVPMTIPTRLRLPATVDSVTALSTVDPDDGSLTAVATYTLRNSTIYGLRSYRGCEVEVEFVVSAAVPADIVALVAGVVAGRLALPAAGVTSELIGPNQVTFGNNSGRIYFSASDKAVLRRYRLPGSAIRLA